MCNLNEFEKWQIVGARMTGASVTKTAELIGFSRATMLRTITEFKKWKNLQQPVCLPTETYVH